MDFLSAITEAFSVNSATAESASAAGSAVRAGYKTAEGATNSAAVAKMGMEEILAEAAALQQQQLSAVASADGVNPNDPATYDLVNRTALIHKHVAEANRIKGDMAATASLDPLKNPLEWLIGQVTSEFQQEAYKNHTQLVDDNLRQIGVMNDNLRKISETNKLLSAASAKDLAALRAKEIAADATAKNASLAISAAKDGLSIDVQKADIAAKAAQLAAFSANEAREEIKFGWAVNQERRNALAAELDLAHKKVVFGRDAELAPLQVDNAKASLEITNRQLADMVQSNEALATAGRAVGIINLNEAMLKKLDKETQGQIAKASLGIGTPLDKYNAWVALSTTSNLAIQPPAGVLSMLTHAEKIRRDIANDEATSVRNGLKWDPERRDFEFNARMRNIPLKEAEFISTAQILDASPMLKASPYTEALKAKALASPTNTVSAKEFVNIAVETIIQSGGTGFTPAQQEVAIQQAGVLLAEYQRQAVALVQRRLDYTKFGVAPPLSFPVNSSTDRGQYNSLNQTEAAVEVARAFVKRAKNAAAYWEGPFIEPKNVTNIPE